MKSLLSVFVLATALYSSSSFGAYLGVILGTRFAYQDLSQSCFQTQEPYKGYNLKGEIRGGKLVRGSMANSVEDNSITDLSRTLGTIDRSRFLELQPQELAGIELAVDALGEYYVKTLPLSARVLNWMFFNASGVASGFGGCIPTQGLRTLTPYGATYRFAARTSVDYFSPVQRFRGERYDGTPYVAKLGLFQQQMDQ